jgi:hypothetical protein
MVYQVHLSREDLQQKFSKLRKLKYNQFRWWRMYDDPKPKLHPRTPLRDRIMNGDFDYPHYKYQAMWVEHDINDMRELYKNDSGRYVEESSLLRTRRKRLMEDFEKEENEKLESLVTEFTRNFKCSVEQAQKGNGGIRWYIARIIFPYRRKIQNYTHALPRKKARKTS